MKILYYSDQYTWQHYGTKRSIYEEIINRNIDLIWIDKTKIKNILEHIKLHKPNQIWLAHSNLTLTQEVKVQITIPIIGFGFSDPYYFSVDRFNSYDIYVTNSKYILNKYKYRIPMIYNATACDFKFHKPGIKKDIITCIGRGKHPRFTNPYLRIDTLKYLIENRLKVDVYGKDWTPIENLPHTEGNDLLKIIQNSKLGLDIQDTFSPPAHRMFEYAGCAVPVITRKRDEVIDLFKENEEIFYYETPQDIINIIKIYSYDDFLYTGWNAYRRCQKEHNISHRIDTLFKNLNEIFGEKIF